MEHFTFSDICSGIGGMRLAFEGLGGKCIFASEWDRFCQRTYVENFGDMPHGDITKVPLSKIPKHDILIAGFPCQPFSRGGIATRMMLNKMSGFQDREQGRIFFRIVKIIAKTRPRAILLENVPQIEKHNAGRVLNTIIEKLENLGYSVNYKIISSEGVVPQKRLRLYIVALSNGQKFTFPDMPNLQPKLANILEDNVNAKYTLSNKLWGWLQRHARKHKRLGNGYGFRLADLEGTACTLSARYGKDGSEILIPQRRQNPRKLSPRECARLMGFPDHFRIPVSDTQSYKQFGNSVVVPVIQVIGQAILTHLKITNNTYAPVPQIR